MTLGRNPRVVSVRPLWQLFHGSTVVAEAARFHQRAIAQSRPVTQQRTFTLSAERLKRVNVTVPSMAESINEGILASLSADIGDSVEADQELATVETDKIDVPINSPEAGVVVRCLVGEGDTVSVGQTVAVIETQDGDLQTETQAESDPSESNPSLSAATGSGEPSDGFLRKSPAEVGPPNSSGERVVSI